MIQMRRATLTHKVASPARSQSIKANSRQQVRVYGHSNALGRSSCRPIMSCPHWSQIWQAVLLFKVSCDSLHGHTAAPRRGGFTVRLSTDCKGRSGWQYAAQRSQVGSHGCGHFRVYLVAPARPAYLGMRPVAASTPTGSIRLIV